MKIYFITFGGPTTAYHNAVTRICNQANKIGLFTKVIGYTEKDLITDKPFWKKHGNFIKKNKRGYGYWIWKPYLILKTLNMLDDNDILLYLDCGCEINYLAKKEMSQLIELTKKHQIVTATCCTEKNWTKIDLINFLNMNNEKYLNSEQIPSGHIFFQKTHLICDIVQQWYDLCQNYHLLDDSKSADTEPSYFKEHRHDQSILSLLLKKHNLANNYLGNTFTLKFRYYSFFCKQTIHWPIWAARNKSSDSILEDMIALQKSKA